MSPTRIAESLRARQERFAEIALPVWLQILSERRNEPGYDDNAAAIEAAKLTAHTARQIVHALDIRWEQ